MAWICVDVDGTLVSEKTGQAEPGAIEAMMTLLQGGHRVTLYTARFHGAPKEHKELIFKHLQHQLDTLGIPYSDIWEGNHKPAADAFIDDHSVPYRGDWGHALSELLLTLRQHDKAE